MSPQSADYEREDGPLQWLDRSLHDLIVTMQSALIAADQEGSERAFTWIENALDGPDLWPVDIPEGWTASDYYARHRSGGHPCMAPDCEFWSNTTYGGTPLVHLCDHHGDRTAELALVEELRA